MSNIESIFAQNKKYYDAQAQTYFDRHKDEVEKKPYDRLFLDLFSSLVPGDKDVLDAGCGSSAQQAFHLSKTCSVTAIDLSAKNIELAQSVYPTISFFCRNIVDTRFEDASFDGVCAMYSMIHIPKSEWKIALAELWRILKPNGMIAIAVHEGVFEGFVDNSEFDGDADDQKVYFSALHRGEVDAFLEASRFEVLHTAFRKRIYNFEYNSDRCYVIGRKIS